MLQLALLIFSLVGYAFFLGCWAGARWRRAHDAARYAQIEARRLNARALKADQLARARPDVTVTIDWNFALSAIHHAGFDVVERPKGKELH